AKREQLNAQAPYRRIDPGLWSAEVRLGAGADDRIEVLVAPDVESRLADRACEPTRQVEFLEGEDPTLLRIDPIDLVVVSPLGHGKDAKGVGTQQHLRGDLMGRGSDALGRLLVLLQLSVATMRSSERMS